MHRILWENLSEIQKTLGLNAKKWAEYLEMSESAWRSIIRSKNLPLDVAATLSEKLTVDIFDLASKKLDMGAVFSCYHKLGQLPEKYQAGAFSRARTLLHILDYIERKDGVLRKKIILRKFQIDSGFFCNPENLLNIHFITDLTNYLRTQGYTNNDFIMMGRHSSQMNTTGPVAKVLREAKSFKNGVEIFFEHVSPLFDRNYQYKVNRYDHEKIVVSVKAREEALDSLKSTKIGNQSLSVLKMGIFSALPCYLQMPGFLPVNCTHSMYEGHSADIYEIGLNPIISLSGTRNSGRPAIYH